MAFPKANPDTIALLTSLVPPGADVVMKPMFGHKAVFVNGNMAAGTFGDSIVVRLGEAEHAKLLEHDAASIFEPMAGRPMKGYVRVATTMSKAELGRWVVKAIAFTGSLPAKVEKKSAKKATAKNAVPARKPAAKKPAAKKKK